jgi:hypothetical protein
MTITIDLYAPDYVSGGDPYFVQTINHEANNYAQLIHFLVGFSHENNDYIIKNVRLYP